MFCCWCCLLLVDGKVNVKVAPLSPWILLFSARILPPWASTMLLQIYNPNPVPEKDLDVIVG
jgi:hypothetical protein